ncbi:MAG: monogalactosyldiacylglycerol synthase [Candidatus Saganbacteria bacterium]|uniref:Monogalactosyldiacylglycerol synthase n=1 Tax=Candidatus Saganbacteria bacterium TaxID=2575572 RepID=A0A833NSE3_UNCSA|nr:MAG: monogalactosyldiacylglycerol synthase [Candidatus Saganbacteria bacterium]
MKKILYLFSDTGGGHRSAATAILNAVGTRAEQEMIDAFSEGSDFLNAIAKLYGPLIKFSPNLWGMLYYFLDDEKKLEQLLKLLSPFILNNLTEIIKTKKPDLVVSVHPLVNQITVQAIKNSGLKIPFIVVITDPITVHRIWVCPEADLYIVATEDAKKLTLEFGVPENKIKVIGMPIHPKFAEGPLDKEIYRIKEGLDPKLFTILLMGGGEGTGNMGKIIQAIDKSGLKVQIIAIAGRNKRLVNKLQNSQFNLKLKAYGFTDQVPELMSASDIIITKAGPGTIAEALAMNLPIIITSWLPGQEEPNVKFIVDNHLGFVTSEPKKIVEILKELNNSSELKNIMKSIEKARKPHAAIDIANCILEHI